MHRIILLLLSLGIFSIFQLAPMQKPSFDNNDEEVEYIIWNELIELAKDLRKKFSENKKHLKTEVINELQTRITTAYYAAQSDHPPLNDLHHYLKNMHTYLQGNLDDSKKKP